MKRHGVKTCIDNMESSALNALNAQAEELYMIQIKKYYVYKTGKLKNWFYPFGSFFPRFKVKISIIGAI